MERIHFVEITGKTYPLNFSVRAAGKVMEKYGGIAEINTKLGVGAVEEGNRKPEDTERETLWMLALLMREGAAYEQLIGEQTQEPLTEEQLAVLLSPMAAMEVRTDVFKAVSAGLTPTVEVEPDTKNAEATQGT